MIVNCFTFFRELDLLDLRLHELSDLVDRFVLVEGELSHTGKPKPLYYYENRQRFRDFAHQIDHHVVTSADFRGAQIPYGMEARQQDAFDRSVAGLAPDDWIIVSDSDEIPSRDAVTALYHTPVDWLRFEVDMYYYTFTHFLPNVGWTIPALKRRSWISGSEARMRRENCPLTIPHAGWHFSYLGDVQYIQDKMNNFTHVELNTPYWNNPARIQRMINEGVELFERQASFPVLRVPVTSETHPRYVVEHPERFRAYIGEDTKA